MVNSVQNKMYDNMTYYTNNLNTLITQTPIINNISIPKTEMKRNLPLAKNTSSVRFLRLTPKKPKLRSITLRIKLQF